MTQHRRPVRWAGLAASAVLVGSALTALLPASTAAAAPPTADWLHVDGNRIVDEAGNTVRLSGANWFGYNASERVFHGLWSVNIEQVTKAMADRGINLVRVPISTQLLLEWKAGQFSPVNVNLAANPELTGKNSLQIFDYWLTLCEKYGLKVMLDAHSADADNAGHNYPMWYKGSITPELFYQSWEWVTARYRTNDTVVAMDIENEPHGKQGDSPRAKWDGSTDVDNFKNACQVAGRRILAINPKVLIMCEGIEIYPKPGVAWSSTGLKDYYGNWWGGNLRGVRDYPVDLGANQDQLVYSPHDYGPLVYEQPWFATDFDKASLTDDVWRPNWLYLHEDKIAPLLIGEWGGRVGQDARQDKWLYALRDTIVEYGLSQTFWCLNPNSGDTGGLLLDDWKTWDEAKYKVLKPTLWQYQGKFVSLDHQIPLGGLASSTGISLAERYSGGGGTGDGTPPTAPGRPAVADVTATGAKLSWTASTDDVGVAAYDVFLAKGSAPAAPVARVTGLGTTLGSLEPSTQYTVTVRARDAAGNVSVPSAARSFTTSAGGGSGGNGCTATYRVTSNWPGGFMVEVTVANPGTAPIGRWTVTWTNAAGNSVASLWNGTLTVSGSLVTVANAPHNGTVPASGSTTFGFVGSGDGTNPSNLGCAAV